MTKGLWENPCHRGVRRSHPQPFIAGGNGPVQEASFAWEFVAIRKEANTILQSNRSLPEEEVT